ncbi:MAG TPA: PAS domain-containing protein, partial [Vicinamibacterales bacterium]
TQLLAEKSEIAAARDALEQRLTDAATAHQQAAQRASEERANDARQASERYTALEQRFDREVEERQGLEQRLSQTETARQDEQQRHASELAAAASQLATREAQLLADVAGMTAAKDAFEQKLADATAAHREAALRASEERAVEARQASERYAALAQRLDRELEERKRVERKLSDTETERNDERERHALELTAAAAQFGEREADQQQRHASELAKAAQDLADRQARHDAELAREGAARDALQQQLAEAAAAFKGARQAWAAKETAASEHAARREAEIAAVIAAATATKNTLEADLARETAARQSLEQQLAEAREYRARIEERAASEKHDRERAIAARDTEIQDLRTQLEALQRSLQGTQKQLESLSRAHADARETHERARLAIEEQLLAARTEIDQSRAEQQRQFEHAPYGMCRCGPDGALTHVNRAMAQLLRYRSPNELRKVDLAAAVFESADDYRWLIERCLNTGTAESVETTLRRKDGRRLVVRLIGLATTPESIEIAAEDLTSLRAVEEKLRQAERMEAVGRLASEVAVTCDNLLRDVRQDGQQWLAAIESDAALRRRGEQLLDDVTRAAGFLRQLSVYGDKQTSALEPVNVHRVLRDLAPVLKRVAGDDIELVLPKTAPPLNVDVETERVERVLVNVASYARQRMPAGGRLNIELASVVVDRRFLARYPNVRPGAHVLITVTEMTGGLRAQAPVAAADGSTTASTSAATSDKPGVDLGVLLGLIGDCGGHLWMTAEPPGNMVLKIHLPRRAADDPIDPIDPRTPPSDRSPRGRSMIEWFRH